MAWNWMVVAASWRSEERAGCVEEGGLCATNGLEGSQRAMALVRRSQMKGSYGAMSLLREADSMWVGREEMETEACLGNKVAL